MFQGWVLVPNNTTLQQLLISEYHNTSVGGHAGIWRTYHRITSIFVWSTLKNDVRDFVNNSHTCKKVKPFNYGPQELLQPLQVIGKIWEATLMYLITIFPFHQARQLFIVVVDHLSKQAHFSALPTDFIANLVADMFT